MEARGLPIDNVARLALGEKFKKSQDELRLEINSLVPSECCRVMPKGGYVRQPKEVGLFYQDEIHQDSSKKDAKGRIKEGEYYKFAERTFSLPSIDPVTGASVVTPTLRWCRVYLFNPNSRDQLISYMKYKKHPVPKSKEEDDDGEQKDTTDKKELQRLSKKTGDSFYLKCIEYREFGKMRGTYIDGFRPNADGRVHTTFTFDTGTGQLTSRNPNIQNFPKHGRLAKEVRAIIAAPPGHIIVEADFKSYHVLTTGYCAEDPSYMRMARLDMHSFIAGCFINIWKPEIMGESDDSLRDRFAWFKRDSDRKRVRDKQAKPTILGVGFGMGPRRLYTENLEHFPSEAVAKRFHSVLQAIFPKVFAWQAKIRQLARDQQYLLSPFGHMRRFYEVFRWDNKKGGYAPGDQAEEAVAFLPANLAFGNIRECMKELERLGLNEKYGTANNIHDSLLAIFPESLLPDYLREYIPVMTAPSKVLINPLVAPNGLQVDVEVSVSNRNWSDMHEVAIPS